MKDLDKYFKVLSEGMKTLAKGFESVAERVDKLAKAQEEQKSTPKPSSRATARKTARKPLKKSAPKKVSPQKAKEPTATTNVYQIISRYKNGVDTARIKSATGFNDKKVQNIIYKLKKQGKIKTTAKGVYVKA